MKFFSRIIPIMTALSLLPAGAAAAPEDADGDDGELVTFIVQTEFTPSALVEAQARSAGQTRSNAYTKAFLDKTEQELEEKNTEIRDRLARELGVEADGFIYTRADSGFTITCRRGEMDRILDTEGVRAVSEDGYFTVIPDDEPVTGEASLPLAAMSEYRGEGTLIAIIDSGFMEDHPFFAAAPSSPKVSEAKALEVIGSAGRGRYVSEKIPFVHNYATNKSTAKALSIDPEHGTHVAGIAAGKNGTVTSKGQTVTINGTAPEAQLALMACASRKDGTISYSAAKTAIEDACALGADVINMSFGSDYVDVRSGNAPLRDSVKTARESGIVVCSSQGNAARGFYRQPPLVTDIDYSASGFPSSSEDILSVASADTPEYYDTMTALIAADGTEIAGKTVTAESGVAAFADTVKTATEYVNCGKGLESDFIGKTLTGKVALIQRGDLTFAEKTNNAKNAGAIAAVVYDNIEEAYPPVAGFVIPSIFISKADGEALAAMDNKTVYAGGSRYFKLTNYTSPGKPSDFSSWGFSSTMTLTPNITAYGGNVFSSLPDGGYGAMSGTSMSSPYMAGVCACVKSYLNTEPFGDAGSEDTAGLIQQLLMSTAVPIRYASDDTLPYSPRLQGAGMVNADSAMKTPVVLYNAKGKTLIELGDNSSHALDNGFTLKFTARNYSGEDVTFDNVDIDVTTDWAEINDNGEYTVSGSTAITPTYTAEPVTVPAFGTVSVSIPVAIDLSVPNYLAEYFKNGIYLDGFVRLSNADTSVGIPFSGFRGSWRSVPVWDTTVYHEGGSKLIYKDNDVTLDGTYLTTPNGTTSSGTEKTAVLGGSFTTSTKYPIISPKKPDGYFDNITAVFAAKRSLTGVKLGLMQNNDEKAYRKTSSIFSKFTKYTYDLAANTTQKQTLAALPDGEYTVRLTGTFNDGKNKKTQNLDFPLTVTVDNTAPTLSGMELSEDYNTLTVSAEDANYLRSITVSYTDMSGEKKTETKSLDCTEKEYTHSFSLSNANPWTISVTAVDYAYNSSGSEEYALTAQNGDSRATAFKRTLSGQSDITYTGVSGTVTSGEVTKSFDADFDEKLTLSGGEVLIGIIVEGLYDNRATAEFILR